jgi:hypothetical protein
MSTIAEAAEAIMRLNSKPLPRLIERNLNGIRCDCGGYCESVDTTLEEESAFGCGRRHCCAVAFVCDICKVRYAGAQPAPDY